MNARARQQHRRALRQLFVGTALAVVGTAAMVAVTLPMNAAGDQGAEAARTGVAPSATAPATPHASPSGAGTATESADTTVRTTGAGVGADPLTDEEIARARQAALAGDRTLRTTSEDVRGRDGTPQFLTVDLGETAEHGARRAEVLFYDYRDDRAVKKTVDLGSGRVVRTQSAIGVQPPPSHQESREALKVLLASPLGDGLRQDFEAATGMPVGEGDRLAVQGLVYERRGTAGPADCDGAHRCVRLFTQIKDGPWIDTRQFVVDLSAREAHRLP
ncbi:hypothetical protein [Streptomyces sp. enrichment culture]|uniref:hypothetical protein n=1 Tax=Streptomyces sp. enrichment culture TaxID=1795815 RepID=UPI003F5441E2